ncbi:SMC-Scp complex subunit ScpB [Halalkalibaculum sp. DA3122]|uniref:SMC-Scp complex subunit ScpB n=1 Tax=unclassified Halalkalibaculum TaxID=2964617 RepID=UPI0037545086
MNDYQFIDGTRLSSVIESIIFSSPEPITAVKLCEVIQQGEENLELEPDAIEMFVSKLNQRYDENGLAFNIKRVAGGFTFATRKKYDPWLSIIQHENAYRKLSQSAIETLAIVAYKQPITKPEVDDIRGVDSGYILRQLLEKVLIEVSGRLDAPGKPLLYRTTEHFLQHFGLNSIDELPKPREIEEILKDDDMAKHRQFLIDRQLELEDLEKQQGEEDDISLIDVVKKLSGDSEGNGAPEAGQEEHDGENEDEQEQSGDKDKVEDVVST